jgi:hypothetical protein
MNRRPQEEATIYTLQRRIGTQRQRLDAEYGPTNAYRTPQAGEPTHGRRFTIGTLLSLRIRAT